MKTYPTSSIIIIGSTGFWHVTCFLFYFSLEIVFILILMELIFSRLLCLPRHVYFMSCAVLASVLDYRNLGFKRT